MNKKLRLVLSVIIVISSLVGLYYTFFFGSFMSKSALYYYTIQSNILILLISGIFIIYDLLNKNISKILYIIKYAITVGITLTFLVFLFMLTPQLIIIGDSSYLLNASNITLHFISPIVAIISFIFCDKLNSNKNYCYFGTIMPLYYMFFALIVANTNKEGIFKNFDGSTSRFPYFFFDYETNGWFSLNNGFFGLGTFYWFIIIAIVVILSGKLFLILNKKIQENKS